MDMLAQIVAPLYDLFVPGPPRQQCINKAFSYRRRCTLVMIVITSTVYGAKYKENNDVMVKQLLFAHSIPGHPRPLGRPHLTWMDTAMHDMGSLGRMLQIDLTRDWASLALHRDVWRGVVSRLVNIIINYNL